MLSFVAILTFLRCKETRTIAQPKRGQQEDEELSGRGICSKEGEVTEGRIGGVRGE